MSDRMYKAYTKSGRCSSNQRCVGCVRMLKSLTTLSFWKLGASSSHIEGNEIDKNCRESVCYENDHLHIHNNGIF